MLPAGNQARGLCDLTTNATHTTPPCREASPTQTPLLWAEGLRTAGVAPKGRHSISQLIYPGMCSVVARVRGEVRAGALTNEDRPNRGVHSWMVDPPCRRCVDCSMIAMSAKVRLYVVFC